jgi:hypothetical protein
MLKVVSAALLAATVSFAAASHADAQGGSARASMESCVRTTLSKLAQSRAPEAQVGQAVVSRCDGPLRATLAEAINNGEAFICSVESCIGMARSRAAEEAREAYRKIYGSRL